MSIVNNIISSVMQFYISYSLFSYILKSEKLKKKYQLMLMVVICFTNIFAAISIDKSAFLMPFIMFFCVFAISLTFKGQLVIKFIISLLLVIIFVLSEIFAGMLIVALTHFDMKTITEHDTFYLFGVLLSNMFAFVVVKLIGYVKYTDRVKLSPSLFIGLLVLTFTSFYPTYIIMRFSYQIAGLPNTFAVIVISIVLVASNIFLFNLFEVRLNLEHQKIEYAFISKQYEAQSEYYKELINKQEIINKTTHDIKNSLLAIEGYILGNDISGALEKINAICLKMDSKMSKIYTSNIIIDTIVNAKEKEALDLGVSFQVVSSAFEKCAVEAIDLGIILGNALDNAIEACRKMSDNKSKHIYCKIMQAQGYISIIIENTTDKPVQIIDGAIVSSKKSAFHGFGIKNIKTLVEKYEGDLQFQNNVNKVTINILLKYAGIPDNQ